MCSSQTYKEEENDAYNASLFLFYHRPERADEQGQRTSGAYVRCFGKLTHTCVSVWMRDACACFLSCMHIPHMHTWTQHTVEGELVAVTTLVKGREEMLFGRCGGQKEMIDGQWYVHNFDIA